MTETSCAKCNQTLPADIAGQDLAPCPQCGSNLRSYLVTLTDQITFHDGHRARAKSPDFPSDRKLRLDTYSGVEPSHKHGKPVRVHRTIDRDRDWYSERVVDLQTDGILHQCEEPLSKHFGHGTAKPKGEP